MQFTPDQIIQNIATRTGLKPGWIDELRQVATPYTVDVTGLTVANLQQRFASEMQGRAHWCRDRGNIQAECEIEPIRQKGIELGRTFRFADAQDAAHFRRSFPTAL